MNGQLLQAADVGTSWPEATIAVAGVVFVTVVVGLAIWQAFGTWRARMSVAREQAYRALAEETRAAQARLAEDHGQMGESLRAISERLASIEKMLRDVG